MKNIKIREGNTGILNIWENEQGPDIYYPNSDLEKTRELLLEFQELKDLDGYLLKNNYYIHGYNWYPGMVSFLYWHYFFTYIKYKKLTNDLIDEKATITCLNDGEFSKFHKVITDNYGRIRIKQVIFNLFLRLNNKLSLKISSAKVMFFRFAFHDFRSVEIRKELKNLGISYFQVVPPGRIKDIIKLLFSKESYYYYRGITFGNQFKKKYKLDHLDLYKRFIFEKAIQHLEWTLSASVNEYLIHSKMLKNSRIKILYGFDDCNEYIYPLLYALKRQGVRTIAHQHGAYVKRHAGYIQEGISKGEYQWFDKIIVWGEYWMKQLLNYSKVYSPDNIIIGSNKFKLIENISTNGYKEPKNILIPYEFVGNTALIGKYIEKFLFNGFNIFFKPRPDEKIEDQIEAYCLSEESKKKIVIAEQYDANLINNIDIVAGTMTTLVYEMLPYNKIIWILDTEYKHLFDLVEQGLAHQIKLEEVDNMNEKYFSKTSITIEEFFYSESLRDTLYKNICEAINN